MYGRFVVCNCRFGLTYVIIESTVTGLEGVIKSWEVCSM